VRANNGPYLKGKWSRGSSAPNLKEHFRLKGEDSSIRNKKGVAAAIKHAGDYLETPYGKGVVSFFIVEGLK